MCRRARVPWLTRRNNLDSDDVGKRWSDNNNNTQVKSRLLWWWKRGGGNARLARPSTSTLKWSINSRHFWQSSRKRCLYSYTARACSYIYLCKRNSSADFRYTPRSWWFSENVRKSQRANEEEEKSKARVWRRGKFLLLFIYFFLFYRHCSSRELSTVQRSLALLLPRTSSFLLYIRRYYYYGL